MLLLTARWNVEQVYIQWAHVSLLLVSLSVQELVVGGFCTPQILLITVSPVNDH